MEEETRKSLLKLKAELENFTGGWDGDNDTFQFEDGIFSEDDVGCAQEGIDKIDELLEVVDYLEESSII